MVSARWPKLLLPGVCMAIGVLFFLTQLRNLNTLLVGEEAAITLGVDLTRWRRIYMVVTSLLSAVAVCTCGIVGFVHSNQIRDYYKAAIGDYFQELKIKCGQYQIDLIPADITKGFDQILLPYVLKRQKAQ